MKEFKKISNEFIVEQSESVWSKMSHCGFYTAKNIIKNPEDSDRIL